MKLKILAVAVIIAATQLTGCDSDGNVQVMRAFSNFPGALRACAYFRDPTAVSRMMH